jgi:hypothetical protein
LAGDQGAKTPRFAQAMSAGVLFDLAFAGHYHRCKLSSERTDSASRSFLGVASHIRYISMLGYRDSPARTPLGSSREVVQHVGSRSISYRGEYIQPIWSFLVTAQLYGERWRVCLPYAMGAINKRIGSFHSGLIFAGISLFTSAMLILALRKRIAPETGAVAMTQASPAVIPIRDVN